MTASKLIGKRVEIKSKGSFAHGEWGIVKHFDGDRYHVGLWGDRTHSQVFDRDEIICKRRGKK